MYAQPQPIEVAQNSKHIARQILQNNTPQTFIGNKILSTPNQPAYQTKKMLMSPQLIQPSQKIILPMQSPQSSGFIQGMPVSPSPVSRPFNGLILPSSTSSSSSHVITRNSQQYFPAAQKQLNQQKQSIVLGNLTPSSQKQLQVPIASAQQQLLPNKITSTKNQGTVLIKQSAVLQQPNPSQVQLRQQQNYVQVPQKPVVQVNSNENKDNNNMMAINQVISQQQSKIQSQQQQQQPNQGQNQVARVQQQMNTYQIQQQQQQFLKPQQSQDFQQQQLQQFHQQQRQQINTQAQPSQDQQHQITEESSQAYQLLGQLRGINQELNILKSNYEQEFNQRMTNGEQLGEIKEQFKQHLIQIYSQLKYLSSQYPQILLLKVQLPDGQPGIPRSKGGNDIENEINQLITGIEQAYINNIQATYHPATNSNPIQEAPQQSNQILMATQPEGFKKLTRLNSENSQQFARKQILSNHQDPLLYGSISARNEDPQAEGLVQYSPIIRAYPRYQQEQQYSYKDSSSSRRVSTQGEMFVFKGDKNIEQEYQCLHNNNNMLSAVTDPDISSLQETEQPIKRALLRAFSTSSPQKQQKQQSYLNIPTNQALTTAQSYNTSETSIYNKQTHPQQLNHLQQQSSISQYPPSQTSTDFNIVTTHGYQLPPKPAALPPYQPLFFKESPKKASPFPQRQFVDPDAFQADKHVSQFLAASNQFEIKTTSKDLTELMSQSKYAEVSEYAYHTLSDIDMQLIHIKTTIQQALEEVDMPNTKKLLAEVIESLRITLKTQDIDISQKAIYNLQKSTQRLLHDKTASYGLYLYLQKITAFLQERENVLNQSYQAHNEMKLLSESQVEFFNENSSENDNYSNILPNREANHQNIEGQQQYQQISPVKVGQLFSKSSNKQDNLDVPEYVPIKEHLRRQESSSNSKLQYLEISEFLSKAKHSQSVNGELVRETQRQDNQQRYLDSVKRSTKNNELDQMRRSSSCIPSRSSLDRIDMQFAARTASNKDAFNGDSNTGNDLFFSTQNTTNYADKFKVSQVHQGEQSQQVSDKPIADMGGYNFNTSLGSRDNKASGVYNGDNLSSRSYEYEPNYYFAKNNSKDNSKQGQLDNVHSVSAKTFDQKEVNLSSNSEAARSQQNWSSNNNSIQKQSQQEYQFSSYPEQYPAVITNNPYGLTTFQPPAPNKTYEDHLSMSFNPNKTMPQYHAVIAQQQSQSNSFAVIDNESSSKIDLFNAEEGDLILTSQRTQKTSQDPELIKKMKFYELAIHAKVPLPKSHPAHEYLITSLWEGASSIPESSWQTYINQKYNEATK